MKNIVFDIDGTICFNGKTIDIDIAINIMRLMSENNVIFASARPLRDSLSFLQTYFTVNTVIGCNGAMLYNNGKISIKKIDENIVKKYYNLAKKLNQEILIDYEWDYFYDGSDEGLIQRVNTGVAKKINNPSFDNVVKVAIIGNKYLAISKMIKKEDKVSFNIYNNENIVDIINKDTNKYTALKEVVGEYIAFGNDKNDMEMLLHSKKGYIVSEQLKLEYSHITNIDKVADTINSLC
jgi:hydroxymethylpyrimidine pyrophosphatase-like HAD family hydrolase